MERHDDQRGEYTPHGRDAARGGDRLERLPDAGERQEAPVQRVPDVAYVGVHLELDVVEELAGDEKHAQKLHRDVRHLIRHSTPRVHSDGVVVGVRVPSSAILFLEPQKPQEPEEPQWSQRRRGGLSAEAAEEVGHRRDDGGEVDERDGRSQVRGAEPLAPGSQNELEQEHRLQRVLRAVHRRGVDQNAEQGRDVGHPRGENLLEGDGSRVAEIEERVERGDGDRAEGGAHRPHARAVDALEEVLGLALKGVRVPLRAVERLPLAVEPTQAEVGAELVIVQRAGLVHAPHGDDEGGATRAASGATSERGARG